MRRLTPVLLVISLCAVQGCALLREHRTAERAEADAVDTAVARLLRVAATKDDHDAEVDAVAAFGTAAVPSLSQALTDPDEQVRLVTVEALRKIRGEPVVDALLSALNDQSADVRLNAVEALGGLANRRATQPLLDQFAKDSNPQVRYECLTSLGLIGDPAAVDALVAATGDADPYVRMWSMDALCQMHEKHAQELALSLLRDPSSYVRDQVIRACSDSFNTPDGHRVLIALALDADDFTTSVWARRHLTSFVGHSSDGRLAEQIRAAARPALRDKRATRAALLLGDLSDRAAVDQLMVALRDPDFLVRHHAAYLLSKLRDRRAVPALIAALNDKVVVVAATAYSSLQWFADDGDRRAQEAVRTYQGKKFDERLPR